MAAWLVVALSLAGCGDAEGVLDEPAPGTVAQAAVVCAEGEVLQGIDVSYYQGDIDWGAVAGDGISFAIARVNHGDFIDPQFAPNWQGIRDNGMIRGAYQYFDPGGDPELQATTLIDRVGTLKPGDLPAVIDVESTDGLAAPAIVANIKTWVDLVEAGTGRRPIIYTGQYFWNDNVASEAFDDYPLWLAQYTSGCPNLPNAWSQWLMWQYTGSGGVAGIGGAVDRNEFNGDLLKLNDWAANGYRAELVAVDYPSQVEVGALLDVTLTLTNLGARSWNGGTNLATSLPRDRESPFATADWPSTNRVMTVGEVASGETVALQFQLRAPMTPGSYQEHFNLVQEGVAWFSDGAPAGGPSDDTIALALTVVEANLGAGVGATGSGGGDSAGAGGEDGGGGGIPNTRAALSCAVRVVAGTTQPHGQADAWGWLLAVLGAGLLRRRRGNVT